jgi:hypothetical protein
VNHTAGASQTAEGALNIIGNYSQLDSVAEIQQVSALLLEKERALGEKSGCADDSIFARLKTAGGNANLGAVQVKFSFRMGALSGAPVLFSSAFRFVFLLQ